VKAGALHALAGQLFAAGLGHVPGNGLALAVRVGRQQHRIAAFQRLAQIGQGFAGARHQVIGGCKAAIQRHAQLLGRQVAHVAHAGADYVARAKILAKGFGFGGAFNDDEGGHYEAILNECRLRPGQCLRSMVATLAYSY
jgi:hypothetical protein